MLNKPFISTFWKWKKPVKWRQCLDSIDSLGDFIIHTGIQVMFMNTMENRWESESHVDEFRYLWE